MLRQLFFINLFLLASLSTFAQKVIKPSGNITTESHNLSGFTGIDISTDFKAIVTFANETSVRIEADDNMHPHLEIEVTGNTLSVRHSRGLNIRGKETLIAHITVPTLNNIAGSDDALIELKNELKSPTLKMHLSGDSMLNGMLSIGSFDVELEGDSYLTVSGSADNMHAHIKGDSMIKDFDFVVQDLNLSLKGDSMASITVQGKMNINVIGDSVMQYKGTPKIVKQHVGEDSVVRHME